MLRTLLCSLLGLVVATGAARAQPDPSGIDFVTIGSPGNAPWMGNGTEGDRAIGRGGVGYEYKIGRFEVTTAQWAEFMNAALDRPSSDRIPHVFAPSVWGATGTTPQNPGAQRFTVPGGRDMLPAGGISWRTCAVYCNWLTNDKRTDRAAFLNGAYDVSTFTLAPIGFNDQLAHNPGARYWIPTWDEWLKSAHFDPNRNGPGQGGWWTSSNGTDLPLAYGPPGVHVRPGSVPLPDPNGPLAQANGVWGVNSFPGFNPFSIPLGSYETQSPWGLVDMAGATAEWTEEVAYTNDIFPTDRVFDGTAWDSPGTDTRDRLQRRAADAPMLSTTDLGFRIASAIPSLPTCTSFGLWGMLMLNRQRRR